MSATGSDRPDPGLGGPRGYVLGITERIWEGRELGNIRRWYADEILVRSPTGLVRGNEPVVASSTATLAEWPDRRLPGEDVIVLALEDGAFLSSHRLLCWMTHEGDGAHGPASGRTVRYRIIADCLVRANQVQEEWLARDQGAIARGLGMSPRELAQHQIAAGDAGYYTPRDDAPGRYEPLVESDGIASTLADFWQRIFVHQDLSAIGDACTGAAMLEGPGGESHVGTEAIDRFFVGYLAAFPAGEFRIEHLFAVDAPGGPGRIAMRWSLSGTHRGWGRFGPPSSHPVHVMGFTHAEILDGRVARQWVITDEVAIWKQILAPHCS